MVENIASFQKVANYLLKTAAPKRRLSGISAETELYYDLGIYGHDLFEFVLWIQKEFGLTPTLKIADYAPSEWPFLWMNDIYRKITRKPPYKSLKVRDVLVAIERKHWQ